MAMSRFTEFEKFGKIKNYWIPAFAGMTVKKQE